jgi:DNA recombination protein RmuC
MMSIFITAAASSIALLVGFLAGRSWGTSRDADDVAELARVRDLAEAQGAESSAARTAAARAEAIAERLTAENAELKQQARRDHDVIRALEPVRLTLADVSAHVARLEKERTAQYSTLAEQLRLAADTDERLRQQTEALVGALKTTSARGQWGEVELRRVLEISGLSRHVDFVEQARLPGDAGPNEPGRRPDVVVTLPGGKSIAIDAKVPLTAYLDATALPEVGTRAEARMREQLLAEHARALRSHVDALAGRHYWSGLPSSPEFTVMFIPTESLLGEALRSDSSLVEYALARNVAPVTPSSLLALLKTVATIWQQATVAADARELMELGRELYSRLGTLGERTAKLGRSLASAVRDYNGMVGSLERNLVVTARRFEAFDSSKLSVAPLDPHTAQVRRLTAPELSKPEPSAPT